MTTMLLSSTKACTAFRLWDPYSQQGPVASIMAWAWRVNDRSVVVEWLWNYYMGLVQAFSDGLRQEGVEVVDS